MASILGSLVRNSILMYLHEGICPKLKKMQTAKDFPSIHLKLVIVISVCPCKPIQPRQIFGGRSGRLP
jgi:hypothetical protein